MRSGQRTGQAEVPSEAVTDSVPAHSEKCLSAHVGKPVDDDHPSGRTWTCPTRA